MGDTTSVFRIQDRALEFTVRITRLCDALLKTRRMSAKEVSHQLFRSASSIGANVHEADVAESHADFIHKIGIARKEANETLYWLRVVDRTNLLDHDRLIPITQEARELVAILTSIKRTARNRKSTAKINS